MRAMLIAIAMASVSCDPVHEDSVSELGPEAPGVPRGPTHRPGQPCLVCHGGDGPGKPTFSVAGTVFRTRGSRVGAPGVVVVLTDADGSTKAYGTNEVGTFYIPESQWKPRFPLRAVIRSGGTEVQMKTLINGDGSCGVCHKDPAGRDSVGHIFVEDAP